MGREMKGMTMALSVIISIVVLIVLALAVIAISGGSLSTLGGNVNDNQVSTDISIKCQSWFTNWCITHPGKSAPDSGDYPSYTVGDSETSTSCESVLSGSTCSTSVTKDGE